VYLSIYKHSDLFKNTAPTAKHFSVECNENIFVCS